MASGNDATKCPSCTKSVYRVEEILCAGQSWHKGCFKCGGTGENGCSKKLSTSDFTVDGPNPFCRPCYMKLLSKPVVATDDTIQGGGVDRSTGNDSAGVSSAPGRRPSYNKPSSSISSTTLGISKLACPKCSKSVYKAEEITLAGFSWHKNCFTCGGRNDDDGCRRKLTQNDVHPHRGNPFCKLCIGKQPILDKKKDSSITRNDTEMSSASEEVVSQDVNPGKISTSYSGSSEYGNGKARAYDIPVKKVIVVPAGKESQPTAAVYAAVYAASTAPVPAAAAATIAPTSAIATVVSVDKAGSSEEISSGDAENKEMDDDDLHTIYQDENGVPCTKDGEPLPPDTPKTNNSDCLQSEMSASTRG